MADVNLPCVIGVTARFTLNAQENLNTFWYIIGREMFSVVDIGSIYTTLAAALDAPFGFSTVFCNCISEDASTIQWFGQIIHPQRYVKQELTGVVNTTPTAPAGALPQNVSAGLTLRGDLGTRTNRGTKHMGAVPAEWVDGGYYTMAALGAYNNLKAVATGTLTLALAGGDTPCEPILYHKASPATGTLITNGFIGGTSRVDRRRTVGLGT